jgi:hypothetical protein
MKPALIALVGIGGLIGLFLFEFYLPLVLFSLNCVTLSLILAGTLLPVSSRVGNVVVELKDGIAIPDEGLWLCVEGKRIDAAVAPRLEFHTEPRGYFALFFLGALSLSAIAVALGVHANLLSAYGNLDSGSFALLFVLVFLSFVPLLIAATWLTERVLLLRASVTLGSLDPLSGGYNFTDHNGASYGGTRKLLPINPADNACLVYYWPSKAQFSRSSSGLRFHRLVVH